MLTAKYFVVDKVIVDNRLIKQKHWKIIIPTAIVLAAIIYLSTRTYVSTFKTEKEKLQFAEVFEGAFEDYIKVNGLVEPISTIYLDAIEGGRVEELFISEGSMVKKGDVILRLSNNQLNLSILDSEAQLAEKSNFLREVMLNMEQQKLQTQKELINLEFQLKRRKREFERNKQLYEQDVIPYDEYIVSEDDYYYSERLFEITVEKKTQDSIYRTIQIDQMKHNLKNMKKNLEYVHQRLENLNVKAPFDGQLGMLDAEIGQRINPGQRLGQINVLTSFKISAEIDEHYIERIRKGLSAKMVREEVDYFLNVKKVYPEVRNGQFEIDMVFEGDIPEMIRTGQTYYIDLQLGNAENRMQVSRGSFFQSTGGQWVYVLDETGQFAIKRKVQIGRQNPKYFEVLSGLNKGEKIISSGYDGFGDNEKIIFK